MTIKDFKDIIYPGYNVVIFERDSEAQRVIFHNGLSTKTPKKLFDRKIFFITINYVEKTINIQLEEI